MENKADETRGDLRILHNSKTPFYSLSIIIITFMISLLYLPFRFRSFDLKFTNFLDTNDRHFIFLFCNCILLLLVLDSVTNQIQPQEKKIECDNIAVASVHDHSDSLNLYAQNDYKSATEVKQSGILVSVDDHLDVNQHEVVANVVVLEEEHDHSDSLILYGHSVHESATEVKQSGILVDVDYHHDDNLDVNQLEVVANVVALKEEHDHSDSLILYGHTDNELAMEVKQIEQNGILVGVDDEHDDHLDVDDEHEIILNAVVEEEEHDDEEEAKEFRRICEEFIKKMKQCMHHEVRPYPMIDYQESVN